MVFKLDPESYRKIKELVEKGAYESIENFLEIAVLNQIQLESRGVPNIIEGKRQVILEEFSPEPKSRQPKQQIALQINPQFLGIPKSTTVPILPSVPLTEEIKHSPLWGQINRLVPAKFVLRLLINQITLSGSEKTDLKSFSAYVAENATLARTYIEKRDKAHRIRGEELYVALPKKNPKSQQRFINFYVGKLPSGRWTDGVLTGLSLARIDQVEDGTIMMGLTEAGREFACLLSPLIDDLLIDGKQIENPFSVEEVEFLLNHLKSSRPGEFEYLISVLKFVREGATTPLGLHQKISRFLQDRYIGGKVSEKVVNTMQVGAIGRLVEMRLLGIKKDGQKSKYLITSDGEALLSCEVQA